MKSFFNTRFFLLTLFITMLSGQSPLVYAASDLVFTSLVPCRLLDTRFGSGEFAGPIGDATTISIQTNISDFSAQGGIAESCGMPTDMDASAIMVIVTAVEPPNTGNVRVFPFSAPVPNASVVNFVPGQDIANNTVVPQCIDCDSDISIFVATTANVIVDVIGYFDKPSLVYKIGDLGPAGGWVFYITEGGRHGLEAAPNDQSAGAVWGCDGTEITGADGTAVGTGAQNTADILAGCADPGIAAELADSYRINGFNDWFLPSKDELNLMYTNLHQAGRGGFKTVSYWSSSENGSNNAWNQHFNDGAQTNSNKAEVHSVRAVRAF